MKRFLMVMVLTLICCTSIFAFGIGVQGGPTYSGNGWAGNASVTFKLDSAPWVFAVDAGGFGTGIWFGITADQWIANKTIVKPLNYFIGWGIGGGLSVNNNFSAHLAARLPIGLNMFLGNIVEPYLQVVPSFGLAFGDGFGLYFAFPVNLGLRIWIK